LYVHAVSIASGFAANIITVFNVFSPLRLGILKMQSKIKFFYKRKKVRNVLMGKMFSTLGVLPPGLEGGIFYGIIKITGIL